MKNLPTWLAQMLTQPSTASRVSQDDQSERGPSKSWAKILRDALSRSQPEDPPRGGTKAQRRLAYAENPSFTNHLPFRDFDATEGVFVFDDGVSCGALFEVTPVATEARGDEELDQISEALWHAIKDVLPEEEGEPWVLQCYANNERSLHTVHARFTDYIREKSPQILESAYTQEWLSQMDAHLKLIAHPDGIFFDKANRGRPWSGKLARYRVCLYRRTPQGTFDDAAEACNEVADAFASALQQANVKVRRCTAVDLVEWLVPWLSPSPPSTNGDPFAFLRDSEIVDPSRPATLEGVPLKDVLATDDGEILPPRRGSDVLANYDLGDLVVTSQPRSDLDAQCWWFDGLPHRLLTLQEMTKPPQHGHLTGERQFGRETVTTLLDSLPDGSTIVLTMIGKPQHEVLAHLDHLDATSKGGHEASVQARQHVATAKAQLVRGNKLFPIELGVYVRGRDLPELNERTRSVIALMRAQGLRLIETAHETWGIHKYLQQLPFAYQYHLDERRTNRARLTYSSQIARLLPFYGRSVGTGRPGLIKFNRGGEPVMFDPLADRRRNAHGMILGPTGSGKSAFLNDFALQLMAVYRPRLFILDPSHSFGPLADYFAAMGLSVNYVRVGAPGTSWNPYADALQLVGVTEGDADSSLKDDPIAGGGDGESEDNEEESIRRDLLGEMELKTLTMITGGEPDELKRLDRGARAQIRFAILDAVRNVHASNVAEGTSRQVIVTDVAKAMLARAEQTKSEMLMSMYYALTTFTGPTLAGRMFDTQGMPLPECDVTIIEFGLVAREGRDAELILATMTAIDRIHYLVDKYQEDQRPTFVIHDEVHTALRRPVLAPYIVGIVKLWRKLGAWYWPATQDLEDIADNAKALLNNLEWLIALELSEKDLRDLGRFRALSPDEEQLLKAPTKQFDAVTRIGDYAEAVVIRRPDIRVLFRSIMPSLALALAGTEKEEKAARRAIADAMGLTSMLDANREVARRIDEHRATATSRKKRRWETAS